MKQEAEGLSTRTIALLGLGLAAITFALCLIAYVLVAPTPSQPRPAPSKLEHELFAARPQLGVTLPIERAIELVVADPSLIGARK